MRSVAVLSVVCALVTASGAGEPMRVAAALPLLLVLPGYALTSALFARSRCDGVERVLLALALSLAAAVVVALGLDVAWRLDRTSWAISLATVTVASAFVGVARHRDRPLAIRRSPALRPSLAQTAALAGSLILVAGAFWLATRPLAVRSAQGYTALWLVPDGASPGTVRVGVRSGELEPSAYRVALRVGRRVVRRWDLRLTPAARWESDVVVRTANRKVTAVLYRGRSREPYRLVALRGGGSS
jgi:uncharacterized membrane protein